MSIPDYEELSPWKKFQAEVHYNNLKQEHSASEVRECDRSESTTNPSDLSTLDEPSLTILINHYVKLRDKLPESLPVRDRLVELQQELLKRNQE